MEKEYQVLLFSHYKTIGKNTFPIYNKVSIKCAGELICQAELKTEKGEIRKFEIPTFRVRDIPKVMTKQGWHMAAKVQNAWFDGAYFKMKTDAQRKGKGIPAAAIRTDLINWAWLNKFERVVNARNELVTTLIYTENAKKVLISKFSDLHKQKTIFANISSQPDMVFTYTSATLLQSHLDWQFQFKKIDDGMLDKPKSRSSVDDLFAALGSFTLNAAVHQIRVSQKESIISIQILKIAIYARDTYDFFNPQYLGHWNKDNMELPLISAAWHGVRGKESKDLYLPAAQSVADFQKGKIYFPVGNSDYVAWQNKNKKGGDMILFSDVKYYNTNLIIQISV